MLCPKCKLEMRLISREEFEKGFVEKYACRNKRCPEYEKVIEREVRK